MHEPASEMQVCMSLHTCAKKKKKGIRVYRARVEVSLFEKKGNGPKATTWCMHTYDMEACVTYDAAVGAIGLWCACLFVLRDVLAMQPLMGCSL